MPMVMPSFDAFLSNTNISGSNRQYAPKSLPTITNQALFCSLLLHYSEVGVFDQSAHKWQKRTANTFSLKPKLYQESKSLSPTFPFTDLTEQQLPRDGFDFLFGQEAPFLTLVPTQVMYVRLRQTGRYWYTVLRGLS